MLCYFLDDRRTIIFELALTPFLSHPICENCKPSPLTWMEGNFTWPCPSWERLSSGGCWDYMLNFWKWWSSAGFQDATPLLKKIGSIIAELHFHHLWIKSSKLLSWDLQRTRHKQETNWFLITRVTKTMTTTSSSLEVPVSPFCSRRHSWVW